MLNLADALYWMDWLYLVLVLAAAVVVGLATRRAVCWLGGRMRGQGHSPAARLLVQALCNPAGLIVPILGLQFILDNVPYEFLAERLLRHILLILLCLALGWAAISLLQAAGRAFVSRTESKRRPPATQRAVATRVRLLTRTIGTLIWCVVGAIALMSIPAVRDLGASLLASAGIAGVVAGLAARSVLTNLCAGLQVAISEPILIGDSLVIEGEYGVVEEITSSFVVFRTWDLRRVLIPINYFLENRFENWTYGATTNLLGTVLVYADYAVPVEDLRRELRAMLQRAPDWDGKVGILQVTDCTDRAVQLRALISAADADRLWNLRCSVREQLVTYLQNQLADKWPRVRTEFTAVDPQRTPPGNHDGPPELDVMPADRRR